MRHKLTCKPIQHVWLQRGKIKEGFRKWSPERQGKFLRGDIKCLELDILCLSPFCGLHLVPKNKAVVFEGLLKTCSRVLPPTPSTKNSDSHIIHKNARVSARFPSQTHAEPVPAAHLPAPATNGAAAPRQYNTLLQCKSWDLFPGSYPSCVRNETAGPWRTTCSLTLGVPQSASSSSSAGWGSTEEEAPRGSAALSPQTGPTMAQEEEQTQHNPHAALPSQRQPAPQRRGSQNNAAAAISILH